ncbi:MAG: ATP-binding protein [Candidatus Micrarchaeota archaeon]
MDIAKKQVLAKSNPWWETGSVPKDKVGVKRLELLGRMLNELDSDLIKIIFGIRRSGKTFLVHQVINHLLDKGVKPKNILYAALDSFEIQQNFKSLIEIVQDYCTEDNEKKFIFIDEVQYFDNWEIQLKNIYDSMKGKANLFVTGSSSFIIKAKKADPLLGRNVELHVFPLSFKEFVQLKKPELKVKNVANFEQDYINLSFSVNAITNVLDSYLASSGYPEVVITGVKNEQQYFELYLSDIFVKDISRFWEIKDMPALETTAKFVLQNVGQRFSYTKIANAINQNTQAVMNYIGHLSSCQLISFVEYYSKSYANRAKKEKKVYAIDHGFSSFLFKQQNQGCIVENVVFIQLLRNAKQLLPGIFYWKNTYEVDFVIENAKGEITPIEVKYQNEINAGDFKGLRSFFKHFEKVKYGIMVTKNKFETVKTKDGKVIRLVPLWLFLLSF